MEPEWNYVEELAETVVLRLGDLSPSARFWLILEGVTGLYTRPLSL
jgi:hypothetical protein